MKTTLDVKYTYVFLTLNIFISIVLLKIFFSTFNYLYLAILIFTFLFSIFRVLNPVHMKETVAYYITFIGRIIYGISLNNNYALILLFSPEIVSIVLFLSKLGAISLASVGATTTFLLAAGKNQSLFKIGIVLNILAIMCVLVSLPYYHRVAEKYLPLFSRKILRYFEYTFLFGNVSKFVRRYYKSILIDIACWTQFGIVISLTIVNNMLIFSNSKFISFLTIFSGFILLMVVVSYLIYLYRKKISLISFGREIFMSWTEEFGNLSEMALRLYRSKEDSIIIFNLFKSKYFILVVFISNMLLLLLAILDLIWIFYFQLSKRILEVLGAEYKIYYYISVGLIVIYLAFTYIKGFVEVTNKYKKQIEEILNISSAKENN